MVHAARMSVTHPTDTLVHPRVDAAEKSPAPARTVVADRTVFEAITLSLHDDLETLKADWRAFEETADCTVFQTYAWQSLWRKHIGAPSGSQPVIVVGRESNRILFIIPLAIERGRVARTLTWHAGDLCDYNGPLLAPDFGSIVDDQRFVSLYRSIGAMLAREPRFAYDRVTFDKMTGTIGNQAHPFLALGTSLNPSGAYATHLAGNWDAFYMEKRSSATRRRDRTKRKRLGDIGEVRFVTASDTAEIRENFDSLVEQKTCQLRAIGAEDLFARPGFSAFFLELATDPETRHLVHISELDVGSLAAATNLGVMFRGRYYHILAAYDAGPAARFGPGAAHLHDLMRYAIEQRCTVFDFTIGDEPYKREWSDIVMPLHDHRSAATLIGLAVLAPTLAAIRAKRFIKRTPVLFALAKRARAWLAVWQGRAKQPVVKSDEGDEAQIF